MTEKVLVVPRARLSAVAGTLPAGFCGGEVEAYLDAVATWGSFAPRRDAEREPALKQIIPYCLIECAGDMFLMRRKRGGGESRLHDKLSLGVGGHVNPADVPEDGDLRQSVGRALEREIFEELRVDAPSRPICLGILNDDSNPVGQVHLGFVYRMILERRAVEVREKENLEGEFVASAALRAVEERLETWSRILLQSILVEGRLQS